MPKNESGRAVNELTGGKRRSSRVAAGTIAAAAAIAAFPGAALARLSPRQDRLDARIQRSLNYEAKKANSWNAMKEYAGRAAVSAVRHPNNTTSSRDVVDIKYGYVSMDVTAKSKPNGEPDYNKVNRVDFSEYLYNGPKPVRVLDLLADKKPDGSWVFTFHGYNPASGESQHAQDAVEPAGAQHRLSELGARSFTEDLDMVINLAEIGTVFPHDPGLPNGFK
jgi:hypothetical protein